MAVFPTHRLHLQRSLSTADPRADRLTKEIDRWYSGSGDGGAAVLLVEVDGAAPAGASRRGQRALRRARRALEGCVGTGAVVLDLGDSRLGCLCVTGGWARSGVEIAHAFDRAMRRRIGRPEVHFTFADLDRQSARPGSQVVEVLSIALLWAGETESSFVGVPVG